MSQVLLILSEDHEACRALLTDGIAEFDRIAGLKPTQTKLSSKLGIALFPSIAGTTSELVFSQDQGAWILGVGAWVRQREPGTPALCKLVDALNHDATQSLLEVDGFFALAFGKTGVPGFSVATDLLGSLHIYHAQIGNSVLVSTSSLVLASIVRASWDLRSVRQFMAYGNCFETRTLYKGVSKLPPASISSFGFKGISHSATYWDIADHCFDRLVTKDSVPALASSLSTAVSRIVGLYKSPQMDLTGGFDSRAVFGAALHANIKVPTITNGEPMDPDVLTAAEISRVFGVEHRRGSITKDVKTFWSNCMKSLPLTDGECDVTLYANTYAVHLGQAQEYDAGLNGSVGEICKGYWWEVLLPHIGQRNRLQVDAGRLARARFAYHDPTATLLSATYPDTLAEDFTGIITRAAARAVDLPNTAMVDIAYLALRMQRWQGRFTSATLRVRPCWSPFAFRDVLELALSAPPARKVRHRLMRSLIEHLNPALARIPLAQGYPALPLRWNTAHLFAPLISEAARGIERRVRRLLRIPPPAGLPNSSLQEQVIVLDEVRDIFEWNRMRTAELYRREALSSVLLSQPPKPHSAEAIFGRVLTLELAGRAARI